ncbi:hypothetical protein EXIGLDRAFT_370171 [Exidia glandulosa HHB12029]|uniref:NADP-dependent oxidoreductase domain-containing protein n=1 Tax=Exidia glandulosa HHB12029 TaxID=1314781 RepID=A0A165C289_EXIGL|nr:hypothetical protein EXIGLDRAFT_370171 [Exidia glandulosa HHB12029]
MHGAARRRRRHVRTYKTPPAFYSEISSPGTPRSSAPSRSLFVIIIVTGTSRTSTATTTRCVCRRRGPVTAVDAAGRTRAQEGHPQRRQARGALNYEQALEQRASPRRGREGGRRNSAAARTRLFLMHFLMHFPVAFAPGQGDTPTDESGKAIIDKHTTVLQTWRAMLALPKSKVRNVGVSNFTMDVCKVIVSATGQKPAENQVESHPYLVQDKLIGYCNNEGIHLTASPAPQLCSEPQRRSVGHVFIPIPHLGCDPCACMADACQVQNSHDLSCATLR